MHLGQSGLVGPVDGDDHLAHLDEGDAPLARVVAQQPDPAPAQAGLERARWVVDAGVDDPRVVAALVGGDRRLLVEDDDLGVGPGPLQLARGGQPEEPGADDEGARRRGQVSPLPCRCS
ncbi:hypothetical protein B277_10049 [Janibacter hoylei PVAS-1]|uniref:Uncharacterized protein n=1 Tax=Janibacter hoylei PVAS-1 TaxID=1210046 RepID=K1E699_9MICO|nr:hypothetical protein B277_10049 [Janibacter hoylei PVAS-1]